MLEKVKNIWQNQDGFSLIEAIVTVVILGIAVIPISLVFTRTIETTVDTRRQLEANELVQSYLEHLKSIDMSEIETLLNGSGSSGSRTISFGDNLSGTGLANIPEGYEVVLSYDISTELEDIALIGDGEEPVEPIAVDAVITIDSGFYPTVNVTPVNDLDKADDMPADPFMYDDDADRTIIIDVDRQPGQEYGLITVYYSVDGTVIDNVGSFRTSTNDETGSEGAVRFVMGNATNGTIEHDTTIVVDSNMPKQFSVYIYEEPSNTINAKTEVKNGTVRFSRNLKEVEEIPARIIEITASVSNTITGETLATIRTTKFDE